MSKQSLNQWIEESIQRQRERQQLLALIPDEDDYPDHTVVLVTAMPQGAGSIEHTYVLFKVCVCDDGKPFTPPRWYITGPSAGRPFKTGAIITDYLVWDEIPSWLTDRVHITRWRVLVNPEV